MSEPAPARIEVIALDWPEVAAGDDLAQLLLASAELRDGDVVALTSKVVSKAEGRAVPGLRPDVIARETVRVVARRGDSVIAETRHGLVLAAAGVDSSNVEPGTSLLLPEQPDASARRLREAINLAADVNVAVIVTDTAGRAWRNGQVDLAIGCAGLAALTDLSGTTDTRGNVLMVTAPATADEIASAADLVKGKTSGRPVALVRGIAGWVLPAGDHGLGAAELVRPSELDLFGLGAREAAVAAALRDDPVALAHFPPLVAVDPGPFEGVHSEDPDVRIDITATEGPGWLVTLSLREGAATSAAVGAGRLWERCAVLAAAYRLVETTADETPETGGALQATDLDWHALGRARWVVV